MTSPLPSLLPTKRQLEDVTSSSPAPVPAATLNATDDISTAVLEGLAAYGGGEIPAGVRENDELRRRVLASAQKLVAELETPAETSQRILYTELELCAARIGVDLDLFGILAANSPKPLTTEEIAARTTTTPDINLLARILRYMASVSMVREVGAGLWMQSNYGSNLMDQRQRAGICHVVIPAYQALPAFLRARGYKIPTSNTDTPFALGHNSEPTTFYKWLQTHPANAGYFHEFMNVHRTGVRTWLDDARVTDVVEVALLRGASATAAAQDGSKEPVLFVDVGGGMGQQCKLLKSRYPELRGKVILQDLPEVVAKLDPKETDFETMGINFFESQPVKGAAIYYLRSIFRNWSDESSKIILKHIRDAMEEDSILVIDDLAIPDVDAHRFETQLDLTMLAMLNGQARTRGHWKELLPQAGLAVSDIAVYEEEAREAVIIARKGEYPASS